MFPRPTVAPSPAARVADRPVGLAVLAASLLSPLAAGKVDSDALAKVPTAAWAAPAAGGRPLGLGRVPAMGFPPGCWIRRFRCRRNPAIAECPSEPTFLSPRPVCTAMSVSGGASRCFWAQSDRGTDPRLRVTRSRRRQAHSRSSSVHLWLRVDEEHDVTHHGAG